MQESTRREIAERLGQKAKELVKGMVEKLMLEERAMYLEQHPTKGNGYYTRDLLTLFGPLEELRVPRVRVSSQDPARAAAYQHRAVGGHTGAVRLWGQHQGHLPVLGDGVWGVLLPPEYLPSHQCGGSSAV